MKLRRRSIRAARIEMLPLIDIVFLLLVFFIYAMLSMAVHRGLQVDLPTSSQAGKSPESELSLTLLATATGDIAYQLGDRQMTARELARELVQTCNRTDPPPVLVFAERTLDFQQLFSALDLLRENGCVTISLQAAAE